jgi:mycofactocin system glycosyltransferase
MSGRGVSGTPPARLPNGWVVRLDPGVRFHAGGTVLVGGSPPRVLQLRPAARRLLAGRNRPGARFVVTGPARAALARLLTYRGLAHPCPPPAHPAASGAVTVIVPVRDRADGLARLLATLDPGLAVIVVDDGSLDPAALVGIVAGERARGRAIWLLRHAASRGPAAARNTGLRAVRTPFAALLDSDVEPRAGWLERLLPHLADPEVALVAPRIVGPRGAGGWLGMYEAERSSLDLGRQEALVVARGRVSYVPSAAMLVRVAALAARADGSTAERSIAGFDESLRVAEDVDLVWRLAEAGWRCRYVPEATVAHDHRTRLGPWLVRKGYYGTGAAPLSTRHPGAVAPVILPAWAALAGVAVLCQRRWSLPLAGAAAGTAILRLAGDLRGVERALPLAARLVGRSLAGTAEQFSAALTRHWWPVAAGATVVSRRARRALFLAGVTEALLDRRRVGADLDPLRYLVARRLDDLAYGAGLWWGAWRLRTPAPLLPSIGHRGDRRRTPAVVTPRIGGVRGISGVRGKGASWETGRRVAPPPFEPALSQYPPAERDRSRLEPLRAAGRQESRTARSD